MEKYTITKSIAAALYGQVLLGRDKRTGECVAIKKISLAAATSHTALRDGYTHIFEDIDVEKHTNSLLSARGGHPHIVRMRQDFVQDGFIYLVFDYCAGGDLFDALERTHFPAHAAKRYFYQIAHAVAFMHTRGIAHRDLSLENVLLHEDDCYVCDFGVAAPAALQTNDSVGKRFYMAPEVVKGVSYDPTKADVWSLGIMLVLMLTGSPLCQRATSRDCRYAYMKAKGLRQLFASWSVHLEPQALDLLECMLKINPAERLTVNQVLSHEYLRDQVAPSKCINFQPEDYQAGAKEAKVFSFLNRFFKRQVVDSSSA
ncbi:unnamed protein product [Aphanomyces euteiches]